MNGWKTLDSIWFEYLCLVGKIGDPGFWKEAMFVRLENQRRILEEVLQQ